jgi:hypothetical protein
MGPVPRTPCSPAFMETPPRKIGQSGAVPGCPQVIPNPLSRSQTAAANPMACAAARTAENRAGLVVNGSPSVL